MSMELDMGLDWVEPIGAAPVAVSRAPADGSLDSLTGDVTFWAPATTAASIEAAAPPYGTGTDALVLPVIQDSIAIPGLSGTVASGYATLTSAIVTGFESQGRKAAGVDLYGYKLTFRLPCDTTNSAFSTTVPSIVARKFGAHQFQDWSRQLEGSVVDSSGVRSWARSQYRRHGRRWDGNVDLDHISYADATAIIQWVRAVRGGVTSFPAYAFGPSCAGGDISVVVRKLTLSRSSGLYWAVRIEASLSSEPFDQVGDDGTTQVGDDGTTKTGAT